MPRFELPLSPNYVKDWTYIEAIREIFQNAIDQATIDASNPMAYDYDSDANKLIIYSLKSSLDRSSLLLGNSTKRDDDGQIGTFGEGYKLAMLVLTRDGHDVEILNHGRNERWIPKIIKSRRFNSELLVVDVHKHIIKSIPDNDLAFIISGVTPEMFECIVESNLNLQEPKNTIDTDIGSILLDTHYQGKVYVKGLFVEKVVGDVLYGYNFSPGVIKLDRDRRAIDTFYLNYHSSAMWVKVAEKHPKLFQELLASGATDIKFVNERYESKQVIAEIAYKSFKEEYGEDTLVAVTQYDADELRKEYPASKIAIVPAPYAGIVRKCYSYHNLRSSVERDVPKSPEEILESFKLDYQNTWTDDQLASFNDILYQSSNWGLV